MLSPRLTNCPECANIPSLLKKIDCKLAGLGNNLYNNISYMLNKPVPADDILQLIGYRRILQYKYVNPNYANRYSVNMIASRVIRLTLGCVSRCNTPEPCLEVPCNIIIVPNPSTTTSSSSTTTTTTTIFIPCECLTISNTDKLNSHQVSYNNCNGEVILVNVFPLETIKVCGCCGASDSDNKVTILIGANCIEGICPTTITTTTTTTTIV